LRPLNIEDAEFCYALETDPDVKKYMGGVLDKPVKYYRNIIAQLSGDDTDPLGVMEKETNMLIGRCGFYRNGPMDGREMYYMLAKDSWDKGYGTETGRASVFAGFGVLKLNRIISIVHPQNRAIIRSLMKLEMAYFRDIHDDSLGMVYHLYKIDRNDLKNENR